MQTIYQKITELEGIPSYSKHQRIVNGVINAINDKILGKGEVLPSVNMLIKELGFARETIVKGYRDLMNRGIIESKNRLGYYVSNVDTEQTVKVALMMYSIDTYQEQLYNSFRNTLGENVHVDVFFHHNNIDVFETMLSHINGKYGMYVICPVTHPKVIKLLEAIPRNKFLMIDRYEPLEGEFNYLTQEFEQASYKIFE
ncbi:MAG: GntR family transcriptional regulator, partial [Daejeonella sp.]|nr:GntR family transcriptional regulator [Daejeonella sp.]